MVYVLFIVIALVSFAVQRTLQSKFERYSKIPIPYGLTGRDIAMRMLQENGINDVPEFALGSCAVRELRFELGTVDFIDRDSHDTGLSGYYAIGYNFICCDDFV